MQCSVVQFNAVQFNAVKLIAVQSTALGELVGANKGNTGESKEEDLTDLDKTYTRKVGERDNVQN